jgi:hypothetical protein
MTAPANALPASIDVEHARLPATYEQAKVALAECEKVDECLEWANRAEALASYAKVARDDSLRVTADRIQARAVRRMGELLQEIDGSTRNKDTSAPLGKEGALLTQKDVADAAGISEHQRKQSVRVANVPKNKFDSKVESDKPPTVTALAEMGRQKREPAASFKGGLPKDCYYDENGKLRRKQNPPRITPAMEERARQITRSVFHTSDAATPFHEIAALKAEIERLRSHITELEAGREVAPTLDDIVKIVTDQAAAGKISYYTLGTAIWKLQQIKRTIPVKRKADKRDAAKTAWRENPDATKREIMKRAKAGSKVVMQAHRELVEASEIPATTRPKAKKATIEASTEKPHQPLSAGTSAAAADDVLEWKESALSVELDGAMYHTHRADTGIGVYDIKFETKEANTFSHWIILHAAPGASPARIGSAKGLETAKEIALRDYEKRVAVAQAGAVA